jgi:hypothetical protein
MKGGELGGKLQMWDNICSALERNVFLGLNKPKSGIQEKFFLRRY